MASFEDADTEETLTCFHVTVYHPRQDHNQVFERLRFCKREKLSSTEVVTFGRNPKVCHYIFQDNQVSRILFSLQPFRDINSSILSFEIKNLSKKTSLLVGNVELGYLNKTEFPGRCIMRFGDYQVLMEKEDGESLEYFETRFMLSPRSLLEERHLGSPVPENGGSSSSLLPTEMDENEY
ncbi:TRAF-interacting protein with FHA domain-containing protein A isoform X1 [Monodelphis domestica]|uniref:TRAF interacting protein with forkhead associated domain n=1 Tax=Monodelphis domestica TaxID=13616 RepID=F6RNB3_MONDO|nr:TRAF-interacting protein with FHA domain-containing protein A isoform X1 [Monodelphis domestica]